ncbi:MAG: hypothetical protein ACXAB4_02845 [Candidatus Hodarchaeales archaeon]|jgi:predicted GTPase
MEQKADDKTEIDHDSITKEIGEAAIRGILSVSPEIDKFSSWFLAGSAASIVLVLTKIRDLVPSISIQYIRLIIAMLGISILFGVLQKYKALSISMSQKFETFAEEQFERVKERLSEKINSSIAVEPEDYIRKNVDKVKILAYVITAIPKFMQKSFINVLVERERTKKGALEKYQEEISNLIRQGLYMTFQLIFGIIAIIIAIISI